MTSIECGEAIGVRHLLASAHLCSMRKCGHVSVFGTIPTTGIAANIWQLTPRGRAMAIREAQKTISVHNVLVNAIQTEPGTRPVPMISGAERPNKPLKPVPAAPCISERERVLRAIQAIIPAAAAPMGKTV
jgi:hypothetical protein